jgi:RNA polymerase sigma factor (sigma-70 family)
MDESPATRRSLIVRLQGSGDQEAWHEFVTLYEPLVYRLARRKGLQDADAHDLCQDVFRAVSRAIAVWDPDPARGSFRGWLSQIARNLLINFLTRRPNQLRGSGTTSVQDLLEAQPAPDPSATAIFEDEYRKVLFQWAAGEVRGAFATTTWAAFWQTAIEGRAAKEVAEELQISVGAVYIARSRVIAAIKKRIEERSDENIDLVEVSHASPDQQV